MKTLSVTSKELTIAQFEMFLIFLQTNGNKNIKSINKIEKNIYTITSL